MLPLVPIAIALVLILVVRFLYQRHQLFHTFDRLNIPGPAVTNILFGNLSYTDRSYYLKQFPQWFESYGDYFGYYRGDRPMLVVRRPDMVQEVFARRFKDFPNRGRFVLDMKPFSDSVLALRDHEWRRVRKTIAPAFTALQMSKPAIREAIFGSVERLMVVLESRSMASIVEMKKDECLVVNVCHMSQCFTLEAICKIAFALDTTDILERDDSHLMALMHEFMDNVDGPIVKTACVVPFIRPFLEFVGTYLSVGRVIDHLIKHLKIKIEEYRTGHEKKSLAKNTSSGEQLEASQKRSLLLDFILQRASEGELTQGQTIGNLLVILLAGYETTAVCLSFTLFLLAQHRQIQKRLRTELINFLHEAGMKGPHEYRNFYHQRSEPIEIRLEVLDRVIYESLRLYPPVTDYVVREMMDSLAEIRLECQPEVVLPRGVAIQVPIWPIQHDASHWPNPFTYDIDRPDLPIPGAKSETKNPMFAAFGFGQRACIGGNLAMTEMRHLVAALVLNYEIELLEEVDGFPGYTWDLNGMLQIEGNAELIKPSKEIKLSFRPIPTI